MVSFSVRLDEELHKAATKQAGDERQSLNAYIQSLIQRDIEQSKRRTVLLYFGDDEKPVEVTFEYV